MVRYKNRYIVMQVCPKFHEDKTLILKSNAVHEAVQERVSYIFGDYGLAAIKAGFSAKYINEQTRMIMIKVRHGPHKFLLKTIPLINDLGKKLVSIKILYVGATMKHCFAFIKKYQTQKLESRWLKMRNDRERRNLEEELMTLKQAAKDFLC